MKFDVYTREVIYRVYEVEAETEEEVEALFDDYPSRGEHSTNKIKLVRKESDYEGLYIVE